MCVVREVLALRTFLNLMFTKWRVPLISSFQEKSIAIFYDKLFKVWLNIS
jgi:hypothetical protein